MADDCKVCDKLVIRSHGECSFGDILDGTERCQTCRLVREGLQTGFNNFYVGGGRPRIGYRDYKVCWGPMKEHGPLCLELPDISSTDYLNPAPRYELHTLPHEVSRWPVIQSKKAIITGFEAFEYARGLEDWLYDCELLHSKCNRVTWIHSIPAPPKRLIHVGMDWEEPRQADNSFIRERYATLSHAWV